MARRLTPMDYTVRLAQAYRSAPQGAEAERALALLCSHFTDCLAQAARDSATEVLRNAKQEAAA